ncbi:hypothetical protein D6C85_01676 [Aureobasidium pullulans]|uniref:Uncharacterized protein n=1 Tax=Aureobasidium pullulans TaxID=5580 RepID=A0A4S9XFW1_AURPU|nr:hypothetical protein D6C85_01676 [Aureobasidium pullulans]
MPEGGTGRDFLGFLNICISSGDMNGHGLSPYLFFFMNFVALAQSLICRIWVVGIREDYTIEDHLTFVGRKVPIHERIRLQPHHDAYTISSSNNDNDLISAIRSDPSVGFVVKVPRNYLRPIEEAFPYGFDEDDEEIYTAQRSWFGLEEADPEVQVSDLGGHKMPFSWYVTLSTDYNIDEHLENTGMGSGIIKRKIYQYDDHHYSISLYDEASEIWYLSLAHKDYGVEIVLPTRGYGNGAIIHDVSPGSMNTLDERKPQKD